MKMYDCIAALATPPGHSGVAVVRISGYGAVAIAERLFAADDGYPLQETVSRQMVYGRILDEHGRTLDRGLCVVFRAPGSYTGEDVVEFHTHGAPRVWDSVLKALYAGGARGARPGEFTRRAFMAGKMDLTSAEAIIDLITAETADAARNAAGQMNGALRAKIESILDPLMAMSAQFHAAIDYPQDDTPPLLTEEAAAAIASAITELRAMAGTYGQGQILRQGVNCAIIGRPNVGKSSLMNALAGYDRAIVTAQPGTTRDTIDECVQLGGVLLRVTDTAGIRETGDQAEKMGVARALAAAEEADLVFIVLDGSQPLNDQDRAAIDAARGRTAVILVNKSDLPLGMDVDALEAAFLYVFRVSALHATGLEQLEPLLRRLYGTGQLSSDGQILTNGRHAEAVERAITALAAAEEALASGVTLDAVLSDVEAAMSVLEEIIGRRISEEIIGRIFDRFCVGK
jgi:tRNA modification GTPase